MPSIAIVGAGPRGISLVERLAAHLRATPLSHPCTSTSSMMPRWALAAFGIRSRPARCA